MRKYQRDRVRADLGIEPLELSDDELAKLGLVVGERAFETRGTPTEH